MWTKLLAVVALAHAGHGFVMYGFTVPPTPEYGSTVYLEANYRLGRGEYIKKMRWFKGNTAFMSYSQRPQEFYDWADVPGVNIDRAASNANRVVITDVGDSASGLYTLEVQVSGPGGNVANIVNSQSMNVGGVSTLGNRFGGNVGGFSGGGGTIIQSTSTAGGFVGGPGAHTSFQSAVAGGSIGPDGLGTRGSFQSSVGGGNIGPESVQAINSALAQAQAEIQNTVNQINKISQALAGIGY